MGERKRNGWAFWLAVAAIALPVLYVGSFGPACWITAQALEVPTSEWMVIYWPLGWLIETWGIGARPLVWWMTLGVSNGNRAFVPLDARASNWLEVGP